MEPILTPEEVEALVELYRSGLGLDGGPTVVDFDLVGGDHLIRRVAPVLDSVREDLAAILQKFLSFHLGIPVEVEVLPGDIVPFAALAASFTRPAYIGILELGDGGKGLLDISGDLFYLAVERSLGGQSFDTLPSRPPTHMEQKIGYRLMERVVEALNDVWGSVVDQEIRVLGMEFWPEKLAVIEPDDFVLRHECRIKIGERLMYMAVVFPAATLEPVRKLLERSVSGDAPIRVSTFKKIINQLKGADVELTVQLGKVRTTLGQLRDLKPGDIMRLDTSHGDRLPVKISGKTKFRGLPTVSRGNFAVTITEIVAK